MLVRTQSAGKAPLAGVLWLLSAWMGQIGASGARLGGGSGDAADGGGTTSPSGEAPRCNTPAVGPSPLRRLTHAEYDNTVRDLLGDSSHPAQDFADDVQIGLFDNTA